MAKKPLYASMSFFDYEVLKIIRRYNRKHEKVGMKDILDQLDDDPQATIRGFVRDLSRGKFIIYTKEYGYKLTAKGLRSYQSFKRKWDD